MGGWRRAVLMALTVALFLPSTATSLPSGVGKEANDGCMCHTFSESTVVTLSGLPEAYESNTTYNLTLTVSGKVDAVEGRPHGGFRLLATNGTVVFNTTLMQSLEGGVTHTEAGSGQRSWDLAWTSPEDNASRTTFTVHGNAVNGNQANTGDEWSTFETVLPGVEHVGDLALEEGIDGVTNTDRFLLVAGLVVLGALLWYSVRP